MSIRLLISSVSFVLMFSGMVPGAHANEQDQARALFSMTEELKSLESEVARLNPIAGGLKGEVNIFGATVSAYVYFPDGPDRPPVAALLMPSIALSTIIPPLKGSPMDVTLDNPIVVASRAGFLHVDKMPPDVAARAKTIGLGSAFRVETALNVFGTVAGHDDLLHQVLGLINLKGPLVAGYSSPSGKKVKLKPGPEDDDTAEPKEKKLSDRVLSLVLPANTAWNEPFFIKNISVEQVAFQMRSSKDAQLDPSTRLLMIGAAGIGQPRKTYDLYVEKTFDKTIDPAKQPILLAINPRGDVTLGDFLSISQAVGTTLGLPTAVLSAGSNLPLDELKLKNPFPAIEAFPEQGAPPDFTKVMFAGANAAAKIPGRLLPGPLLTANADATILGFNAAGLRANFALSGLEAKAKAQVPKLGPISISEAAVDVAITTDAAHMKLDAKTLMGSLDVAFSRNGLSFAVPAQCPANPVGLKITLAGFDPSKDFSVAPQMKDCLSPIVNTLIDDGEKVARIAADLGEAAATTAEETAKAAMDDIAALEKTRAAAWGKAIASKAGADEARRTAQAAVNSLEQGIKDLNDSIKSATKWIENALGKLIGAITGEIKKKKKERSQDIAKRDHLLTKRAAAEQRLAQAQTAAASVPVPYFDDTLRDTQASELGKRALLAQQNRLAAQARLLPGALASADARKSLIQLNDIAADAEAAFVSANGTSLNGLINSFGGLEKVRQLPLPGPDALLTSVVGARLDQLNAQILREEVPKLPTMAFGKRVLVQTDIGNETLCMNRGSSGSMPLITLEKCSGNPDQIFIFTESGRIVVAGARYDAWHVTCLKSDGPGSAGDIPGIYPTDCITAKRWTSFFYDPLDGLIRQDDFCVAPFKFDDQHKRPGTSPCPPSTPTTPRQWRLVDETAFRAGGAPIQRIGAPATLRSVGIGSGTAAPTANTGATVTNLDPLRLH